MNKYLTCLPAVMLLGGIMWAQAKKATQSNLANKDISFAVYKSHSYKSDVYNNTSAQVHIVVEKINTQRTTHHSLGENHGCKISK